MFRLKKKLLPMAMAAIMSLSITTGAFAEDTVQNTAANMNTSISVQLNGEFLDLSEAKVEITEGRTYVSYPAVLEALGINSVYNESTGYITSTLDDKTVICRVGSDVITIKTGDAEETLFINGAPYENQDGDVMLPIRFLAEAFDCVVGWDNDDNAVVIIDKNSIKEMYQGKFTIMDKYLAYSQKYNQNPYAITGDFTFDFSIGAGEETIPLTATGTIEGLSDAQKAEMSMAMKFDLEEFITALGESVTQEDIQEINNILGNIKIDFIMDLSTGKYYMHSPLFESGMGVEPNTWILIDYNDFLSGMGTTFTFQDFIAFSKEASMEDVMDVVIDSVFALGIDDVDAYAQTMQAMDIFIGLFGDDAFKQVNNQLVSEYSQKIDGQEIYMKLAFTTAGRENNIVGYTIEMNIADMIAFTGSMNANDKANIEMLFQVPDLLSMAIGMNMQYSETNETILGEPPAGSNIVPLL